MARYRKIDSRIQNDEKFRKLSDDGKLVWFTLLTHLNMTSLGGMRASLGGLAEELKWKPARFRKAFQEISRQGMAIYDDEAMLIILPKFLKYNAPESPNVVRAWASAYDLLPECKLKVSVLGFAEGFIEGMPEAFSKAFAEAFGEVYRKNMPNPEPEPEQEPEQDIPPSPPVVASEASAPSFAEPTAPGGGQPPDWDDETVAYLRRNSRETAESVRAVLADLRKSHSAEEIRTAINQAECSSAAKPLAFVGAHLARQRASAPLSANSSGMPPPRRGRLQHLDPKFLE